MPRSSTAKRDGWDDLSDWYDRKQGESGDLWHRNLIDPGLLRVVGDCRGKDALDLGCGNGYLSRRLTALGARVTAVDGSSRMIRNAKARDKGTGVRYLRRDADALRGVPSAAFDIVFANMSLMDMADLTAEGAVGEASRVLKEGGRLVASISHPCFDVMSSSGWIAEKMFGGRHVVYRKVTGYRRSFSERAPWRMADGSKRYTACYHRPLNWYARLLRSKGFVITSLEEPEPTDEFVEKEQVEGDLDGPGALEVPLHLVIEAVKSE